MGFLSGHGRSDPCEHEHCVMGPCVSKHTAVAQLCFPCQRPGSCTDDPWASDQSSVYESLSPLWASFLLLSDTLLKSDHPWIVVFFFPPQYIKLEPSSRRDMVYSVYPLAFGWLRLSGYIARDGCMCCEPSIQCCLWKLSSVCRF